MPNWVWYTFQFVCDYFGVWENPRHF